MYLFSLALVLQAAQAYSGFQYARALDSSCLPTFAMYVTQNSDFFSSTSGCSHHVTH